MRLGLDFVAERALLVNLFGVGSMPRRLCVLGKVLCSHVKKCLFLYFFGGHMHASIRGFRGCFAFDS
jgi:hypothetical protein